jgi:hypothetical protein
MSIVLFAAASGGFKRSRPINSKAEACQKGKSGNKEPIAAEPQALLHRVWARINRLNKLLTVICSMGTIGGVVFARVAFFGGDSTRQTASASSVAPSSPVAPPSTATTRGENSPIIHSNGNVRIDQHIDHYRDKIVLPSPPPTSEADNEARQAIVETFDRSPNMRRMMARAIPVEIGGIQSVRDDALWLKGLLQRAAKPESRSALERAAEVYIESIVALANQGVAYPQYKDPKAIDVRIGVLFDVYKKLSVASEGVRGTRAYYTLLQGRMMASHAIRVIAQNANVRLAEALQCANEVREEVRQCADKDGLLQFDHTAVSGLMEGGPKQGWIECTNALRHLPRTNLCEAESLELRFHLLRLNLFADLAENVLKAKKSRMPVSNDDVEWISDRERGAEIEASLEYVTQYQSDFQAEQQSYENMATGWVDTVLAKYAELGRLYTGDTPWDAKIVQGLIVRQVPKSREFVRKLKKAREILPDFLFASVCIHDEAAHIWDSRDTVGLKQVLRTGREFASILLTDDGVLHTPLRNVEPAFADDKLARLKAMRAGFERRLNGLK